MPVFDWSDDFNTGIPDIDKDHREIFSLINKLHDTSGTDLSQNDIEGVIAGLLAYVDRHFAREESLLSVVNYGDFESHSCTHKALAGQMKTYAERHKTHPETFDMDDFVDFLVDWLRAHIMVDDMAYLPTVRSYLNR